MTELPLTSDSPPRAKKPDWLRVKLPIGENYRKVRELVDHYKLHTICQSGNCPNMGECWGEGTATFMILGNVCTRSCSFCAVKTGRPNEYDTDEPARVAEAIHLMKVKHAVITSVNRDELKDKGADIWHRTVKEVKRLSPATTIETLIPDTKADWDALETMISAGQEGVSHNMETGARRNPGGSDTNPRRPTGASVRCGHPGPIFTTYQTPSSGDLLCASGSVCRI